MEEQTEEQTEEIERELTSEELIEILKKAVELFKVIQVKKELLERIN